MSGRGSVGEFVIRARAEEFESLGLVSPAARRLLLVEREAKRSWGHDEARQRTDKQSGQRVSVAAPVMQ